MSENMVHKESHLPIGLPKGSILSENVVKKECRQKQIALKARIKYREHALQGYKRHLKQGTFPKRVKSLKPYPKMDSLKAQAVINDGCQLVEKIILEQMIQDQVENLKQDQASLDLLKKERQQHKAKKIPKTDPKTPTMLQLQHELKDLQAKYTDLSQKLMKQEPQES